MGIDSDDSGSGGTWNIWAKEIHISFAMRDSFLIAAKKEGVLYRYRRVDACALVIGTLTSTTLSYQPSFIKISKTNVWINTPNVKCVSTIFFVRLFCADRSRLFCMGLFLPFSFRLLFLLFLFIFFCGRTLLIVRHDIPFRCVPHTCVQFKNIEL